MNTELSIKRLRQLRRMLANFKTNKKRKFCMDLFYDSIPSCGTVGCALGYAATYKPFVKEGLALDQCYHPVYKRSSNFDAARRFFGINREDVHHIFSASSYDNYDSNGWFSPIIFRNGNIRPRHVVKHVDEVIARKVKYNNRKKRK